MNPKVDHYFIEGCGRCELGGTPQCKVHNWSEELKLLRTTVLDCGLKEELKWGVPCYTLQGKNIALMNAFKEYCSLSFFKGSLLKDPSSILIKPGENTQSTRMVKFTNVQEIVEIEATLKAYLQEAIEVEKKGLKVAFKKTSEYEMPDELKAKLEKDPDFKAAFAALTPGRQRGYLLHFSQPKQSKTRSSRIEKSMPKIFEGKGFNER